MLLVLGEKNLVDRHSDMLTKFNYKKMKIISVYETDNIDVDFSKFQYILLCSLHENKRLKLNILKKKPLLHRIYEVNDSYPSAILFYYIRKLWRLINLNLRIQFYSY